MARAALDHLRLDKILWIPTGAPHYRSAAIASGADRLAMLRLALDGEPRYVIDERELGPQATGYTVDTLKALRSELGPQAEVYLLMGADQYAKFGEWRSPDEIQRLARLAVFPRPGFDVKSAGAVVVPMPPMAHAATDIRRGEKTLDEQVPPAVANYIARKGLYR
jgi:nicotinate-nucleotide adenylyltransferase